MDYHLIALVIRKRALKIKNMLTDYRGYVATKKFIRMMNAKSKRINLTQSYFYNASGATSRSYSTAHDLSILCRHAISHRIIMDIWQKAELTIMIDGPNHRRVTVTNSVLHSGVPLIGASLLGGKSGSWGTSNKAHVFVCENESHTVIISVMACDITSFENIYQIAYELLDYNSTDHLGPFTKNMINAGGGFSVVDAESGETILAINENNKMIPASVTKVLTAICALDSGINLSIPVEVAPIDISSGSGSEYIPGDIIALSDALHIMMMESSNTMANTIARTIGLTL